MHSGTDLSTAAGEAQDSQAWHDQEWEPPAWEPRVWERQAGAGGLAVDQSPVDQAIDAQALADHALAEQSLADQDATEQFAAYPSPEDQPPPLSDLEAAEQAAAERVAAELAAAERDALERAAAELAAAQHAAAAQAYQQMAAKEAAAEQEAARRAAAQHILHPGTPQPPYYPPPEPMASLESLEIQPPLLPLPDLQRPYVRADSRPAYHPLPEPEQETANWPPAARPTATQPAVRQAAAGQADPAPSAATRPSSAQPGAIGLAAAQPATGQPAGSQPEVARPAADQPAAAPAADGQSRASRPAIGQEPSGPPAASPPAASPPAAGPPVSGQPAAAQSTNGQPAAAQPAAAQPVNGQPAAAQPDTGRPYTGQPGTSQLTDRQPGSVRPAARPQVRSPHDGPPAFRAADIRPAAFQRAEKMPPDNQSGSPAELLEFAVSQVMKDDISVDALPVILSRLTRLFSCRAALAFQEEGQDELIVLAAYPRQAGADKVLRTAITRLATDYRGMTEAQGYFQVPLGPAITGSPASAQTSPVNVLMATSAAPGGSRMCAIALIGDARSWDASCRATARALAAIIAAKIQVSNDASETTARQARIGALLEAAPDAIVVTDFSQGLMFFNKAAEELTGWNREEVLGRDLAEVLIPAHARPRFMTQMAGYQERSASGQPCERVQLTIARADGTERLVEMSPVPMMAEQGPVFCAFLRDVGALERAHTELRETEERFRLMSQLAPVGIMQSDIYGTCIFANDRWCELMGLDPEDAPGKSWSHGIDPDDVDRIEREWEIAAQHDGELRTDARMRPIGGLEAWVHLAVKPVLNEDGRAVGFLSAITNVSERKRAEAEREKLLNAEREARHKLADQTERLNAMVDSAIPGILFDDEYGNIVLVNQGFCDLFGLPEKPSELIGTPSWRIGIRIRNLFADPEGFMALTRKLATERKPIPLDEIPCADGRTLEWDFAPVFVAGEYRGNLWGVGDVTDRADMNEQRERMLEAELAARETAERAQLRLTEQNTRLQELDEAKTEFLATMSHELRTPLTSIVSFTDLILDDRGSLPPDTVSSLGVIQRNGERLLRLLGDLLLLSRLDTRAEAAEFSPVPIPELITDSVRSISATAAERGVSLISNSVDGPPVSGDQLRLMQVMDNLLSNAIKFSGRGGQVRIQATHDGQMWRIDVADDGIGIPADEVDQLFGRFVRATNARMAGLPGTGLGLSVVKGITELHGGRVEVDSVVELGTTFSVYLPVQA